jgi:hypothetical protein
MRDHCAAITFPWQIFACLRTSPRARWRRISERRASKVPRNGRLPEVIGMNNSPLAAARPVLLQGLGARFRLAIVCTSWLLGCRVSTGAHASENLPAVTDAPNADAARASDSTDPISDVHRGTSGGGSPNAASALDAGFPSDPPPIDAGSTRVSPAVDASAPNGLTQGGCGQSAQIAVCDPIRNSGCSRTLGMQCDVDLGASTLRGQCVFSTQPAAASSCINIPPTESCPAGQTCVDGDKCHSVCLCDTDCESGKCCKQPLGNAGFKLCGPC